MTEPPPLVLASASPRRRELLAALGVSFRAQETRIDESVLPGEPARDHVVRLAAAKASRAVPLVGRDALVLAADTTVCVDGAIYGKPDGEDDALRMLRALSGRAHEVLTACHLVRSGDGRHAASLTVTRVTFRSWDEPLARWYVGTGEPFDKAGAYALQGRGVLLTEGIEGSWSNVVGLPLEALPALFAGAGDDFFARIGGER